MCSIFGMEYQLEDFKIIKKAFDKSNNRGPDGTRYLKTKNGLLGFKRLTIMGLSSSGMQPFTLNENISVTNGEIYGFKKMKKELLNGYSFNSESDCEIMLPLYEKYGFEMFRMLDAEFACLIYDAKKDKLIAARDPLGIRPLYYGKSITSGKLIYASIPSVLVGLVADILPFPPGYYYDGDRFVRYADLTNASPKHFEFDEVCHNICRLLTDGIKKRLDSDQPIGFLLSGGLDSSLVCSIASKCLKDPIKTFAIGMEEDAIDLKYAKEVADYLHTEHHEVIINKADVISSLEKVISLLGTFDITTIRASIGMYLVSKYIHENTNIRVLLTGEISDELFGYKYTDYAPNAIEFQKESIKRINEIHLYDVLRADRTISENSLEARVPFGDLAFVKYVMEIDPELKLNKYNKGKYLLRYAFKDGYLPDDILYREKAAFSDAVGHSMVNYIKEYAENYYTDFEYNELSKGYQDIYPFSKEALLYRTIFEKYYPANSKMIPAYWMPNKEWPECNVTDPSARVLKNYGDSAK